MTTTREMASRVRIAGHVPLLGGLLCGALVALAHVDAIGAVLYQSGVSALLALGALVVIARGLRGGPTGRAWLTLGGAVAIGMGGNALTGWAQIGVQVPEAMSVALAVVAFALSITGLGLMIAARPGRLPLAAALDGMTGALVIQAIAGVILLAPVSHQLRDGLDVVVVLYPLGDVLLMGLVAAVVAHGGVRRDPWTLALAGLVAMTVGDSASLAALVAGAHPHAGIADLGWLTGTWLLAAAAWSPDAPARTERWIRGWVPVVLGAFALLVLVVIAVAPDAVLLGLGCAAGALAVVVARLALTLRENAAMLRAARIDSLTDALTGLPNRRRLMADIETELRRATHDAPAALALFDLNGFKRYNDTFGHPAGDALLAQLATGLATAVHGAGTAYRMGGDEFCVLIAHRPDDHDAVAERAAGALSGGSHGFTVTAAYGVVRMPVEAASASDALRHADLRMYEHKASGRVGAQRQAAEALAAARATDAGPLAA